MPHNDVIVFFFGLAVMIAMALVFGQIMRKFHQPVVLGELIGGILIGPTVLGSIFPGFQHWLFPTSGAAFIGREAVIKLGILFFLFVAGMEVNLGHLRERGKSVAMASLSGILVPFALGFGCVMVFPHFWGDQFKGDHLTFAIFMGMALSISALPVIARILMDLKLLKSKLGFVVISAATIDDLIGWSLFAMILYQFTPHETKAHNPLATFGLVFAMFGLFLTVGRWLGRRAMTWFRAHLPWPIGFIGITAILVLVAAACSEAIGIHAIFGAFLVGVALAPDAEKRDETYETVYQFVTGFFAAPIYFVSVGLRANFIQHFDLPLVLIVLLIACVGKILGVGFGALISGMPPREAFAVGFGMNARGAMEMILASVALEFGLIDEKIFVALTVMALVTSLVSGPMIKILMGTKPEGSIPHTGVAL